MSAPAAHTNASRSALPTPLRTPRIFMMDLLATVPYYTAYLSRALRNSGLPVQVGSITYYLDRECFRGRGLRLQPGALDVVGKLSGLPKVLRQVLKLVETSVNLVALTTRFLVRPPDVVHIQYLPMLRLALPLDEWFVRFCRWRGALLLLTVHDLLPHDSADRFRSLFKELYAHMDALVCHSDHIRERLILEFAVAPDRISVIPHGPFFFDLPVRDHRLARARYGLAEGDTLVLWQGILFPYKGVDLLLEAWRAVENSAPGAHLVVLGTGAPAFLQALRAQAEQLALQRVHFDFRFCSSEELVDAYRTADVVVYPYRAITTSGALATGLALGKAIVATDLPVFRELLVNEENALLVDLAETGTLSQALLRLVKDTAERHRLAAAVEAMQFGTEVWLQIAAKTAELYRRMLGKRQAELHN